MKYVISEDICILLSQWAKESGFNLPPQSFFTQIRSEMRNMMELIFGQNKIEMVSVDSLKNKLFEMISDYPNPIISLDRCYIQAPFHLDLNRSVNDQLEDTGDKCRFGHDLTSQLIAIKQSGIKNIALVDDVIFSGSVICHAINLLKQNGVITNTVIAGITIGEGFNRIKKTGIEIKSAFTFAKVIDEICERDFYAGVPMSGRYISGQNSNIGAPYFHPFGNAEKWASIPSQWVEKFSIFCLRQSIAIWQAIEMASDRFVRCKDLSRLPIGSPQDNTRFIDFLTSLQ